MSDIFGRVRTSVAAGDREYSAHAVSKLALTGILIKPLIDGIGAAIVVEEYPDCHAGPCVLLCSSMRSALRYIFYGGYRKDDPGRQS